MSRTYRRNDEDNVFHVRKQVLRLQQEVCTLQEMALQMSDALFAEDYLRQAEDKKAEVKTLQRKLDG